MLASRTGIYRGQIIIGVAPIGIAFVLSYMAFANELVSEHCVTSLPVGILSPALNLPVNPHAPPSSTSAPVPFFLLRYDVFAALMFLISCASFAAWSVLQFGKAGIFAAEAIIGLIGVSFEIGILYYLPSFYSNELTQYLTSVTNSDLMWLSCGLLFSGLIGLRLRMK